MTEPTKIEADQIKRFPHLTGIAPQTVKLIEYFKSWKPGDSSTDQDLSNLIGRDIRSSAAGGGAGNLTSALRYVERHHGRVIRRVKGAGVVKCLDSPEIVGVVDRRRQHISRTVRRAGSELVRIKYEELKPEQKSHALILKSQMALLADNVSKAAQKRLAANQDHEKSEQQQKKMLIGM